jgi:hypothetical protein
MGVIRLDASRRLVTSQKTRTNARQTNMDSTREIEIGTWRINA